MYISEIRLGSFVVSTKLLMLIIGVVSMWVIAREERKTFGLGKGQTVVFTALLTAVGIGGVKLLYILENWEKFRKTGEAGMSFFGAVFLVPLLMPFLGRLLRLSPAKTLDLCAPCVASIVGFMRINCFLTGCCGGRVVRMFGKAFLFPAQLFELAGDFLTAYLLLTLPFFRAPEGRRYPLF